MILIQPVMVMNSDSAPKPTSQEMKQRKKKQFSQRTSSKGTFVVVVATTLNIHLDSSIGISLINYTIIISRILNRVDP